MQLFELLCELLKFARVLKILAVELGQLAMVSFFYFADNGGVALLSCLKHLSCLEIDGSSLIEHFGVEVELLLVESVNGLHILHALLKDLHFLL